MTSEAAKRADRIAEYRQRQPLHELERKWRKAQGRWSNRYYAQEWLDLADARAAEMVGKFRELEIDDDATGTPPPPPQAQPDTE